MKNSRPQIIKIVASTYAMMSKISSCRTDKDICPFQIIRSYVAIRKSFKSMDEPFFVFCDRTLVQPSHMRQVLKTMLKLAKFNDTYYSTQSFRGGRAGGLLKMGIGVVTIKKLGCWRSNAVYAYLRQPI